MEKKLVLGRDKDGYLVTLDLKIKEEKECRNYETLRIENMTTLSICGNARWRANCDISYGGQIADKVLKNADSFKLVQKKDVLRIVEIWKAYHLNDLTAGTKKQDDYIKSLNMKKYSYEEACEELKKAGLYEDNGIKYGHCWLTKEIPNPVIEEIQKLFDGGGK